MQSRWFKRVVCTLVAVAAMAVTTVPSRADTKMIRALLLPGTGQAEDGRYTKAALFSAAAVGSWIGLFSTQINYNRSVERYESQKRIYNTQQRDLNNGVVVSIADIDETFAEMTSAWNSSEDRVKWRNVFIGTLIATYTLNLVDMLRSDPETGEIGAAASLSVERRGHQVLLVKSFSF